MTEVIKPFNVINPIDFIDNKVKLDQFYQRLNNHWHTKNGGEHIYQGSTDLYRLADSQAVGVGVILRIWQTELPEMLMVTKLGLMPLSRFGNPSNLLVPPFSELDNNPLLKSRLHHWNIEGFNLVKDEEIIIEIESSKNA